MRPGDPLLRREHTYASDRTTDVVQPFAYRLTPCLGRKSTMLVDPLLRRDYTYASDRTTDVVQPFAGRLTTHLRRR